MSTLPTNPRDDGRDAALDDPRDLVLTASAGTGKTTMLVRKFTRVLIEKIRAQRSADTIRSLVGITFTDLAAMQLKERIRTELNCVADKEEAENRYDVARALRDAVRDLDTSYIGTIHSFCRRVLQENFIAAGISPGFKVLDERDATDLKFRAVFEVLRDALSPQALSKNNSALVLVQTLGLGNTRDHIQQILDEFRAYGEETVDIEGYLARVEALYAATEEVVGEAKSLFEEMETAVAAFNAGGAMKTSLKIEGKLTEAREALQGFFEDPIRIRRHSLPEMLAVDSSIPSKGNMKGLDDYAEARFKFRALLNKEETDGITLRDLELLDVQVEMLRILLMLVNKYADRYRRLKERSDSLDFDDLQSRALHLLEENPKVLASYRSEFSNIFVDEFQDVNAVQRRLVQLLRGFEESDEDRRRLFLVGDSKQSIYRFRAADVRAYNEFAKTIEERGKRYELRLNFRSHDRLIDSFNRLFDPLFKDDAEGNIFQAKYQAIEPGKGHPVSSTPLVRILELTKEDKRYEAWVVANRIRALVEDGLPGYERQFGYGDIAILFRSTTMLPEYEKELRRAGVPYAVIGGKGFHQQREIWDMSSYLNAVWFPEDEYALAAALRSPLCLVSDESLYELRKKEYGKGLLPGLAPRTPAMEDEEYERFARFNALLLKHRRLRDLISTADLINELLEKTGYDAILLAQDAGDQSAANIRKLIEMAREFEARGVGTGLEFALDLSSRLFKDKSEAQATIAGAENAVSILTVHKSKGLEFPVVFLADLSNRGKPINDPVLFEHEVGLAMRVNDPETGDEKKSGLYRKIKEHREVEENAEHLRLLYVAATRSEELLFLPISRERKGGSTVDSWLQRLDSIGALEQENAEEYGVAFEEDAPFTLAREKRRPLIEELSGIQLELGGEVDSEALSRFERMNTRPPIRQSTRTQISVSALLDLLSQEENDDTRYELQQLKRELDNDDDGSSSPREAGTAIHRYLESLDYKTTPDTDRISQGLGHLGLQPPLDESTEAISRWLNSDIAAEIFSDPQCRILKEVPFVLPLAIGDEQVDIIGVIDLLAEFTDGRRWVMDFKFARQKSNPAYRLQMQLYALAIEQCFGNTPERVMLYWLKDGALEEVDIPGEALSRIKKNIGEALRRKRAESVS